MTDKVSNHTRGTDISTGEADRASPRTSAQGSPANTELATKATPLPSHDLVAVRREKHAQWQFGKLSEKFPQRKGIIEPLLQRLGAENRLVEAEFLLADDERLLGFACGRGDAALLDALFAEGISPNHGMAFANVCRRGDAACLKVFLSHGANVEAPVEDQSVLGLAAASGSLESVKLLLDHGADPNGLGNRYLQSPLFCAAAAPHSITLKKELIQLLLDHKADINGVSIVDAESITVLSHACRSYDVDLVKWLLERGADPDLPRNQSALAICIREPQDPLRRDMLVRLMERAELPNNRANGHLVFALHHCNLVAIELLLAKGVDVNCTSGPVTPLMRAVGSHQIPATIVKKLINAGANVNARDSFGRAAMDYLQGAKVKDFEKKMKLLARAGLHRIRHRQIEAKET